MEPPHDHRHHPNVPAHAALGPLASRFVDVETLSWQPTRFPANKFFEESGAVTDMGGADWEAMWGVAYASKAGR